MIQSLAVVEHSAVLEGYCDACGDEREAEVVGGEEEGEGEENEEDDGEDAEVGVDENGGGEQDEVGDNGDAGGLDLSKVAVVEDEERAISSHD